MKFRSFFIKIILLLLCMLALTGCRESISQVAQPAKDPLPELDIFVMR